MTRNLQFTIAAFGVVLFTCSPADAQTRFRPASGLPKGFISANGTYQPAAGSFTEKVEFQEFVETGTIETTFEPSASVMLEGMLGIRLWRSFGLGAGGSTSGPGARDRASGTVTARIPHPLYFNQPREISGDAGLTRGETAIHVNVLYFRQVSPKILAVIGAGPTFFQVEQTFVEDVLYDHEYPYDTATFRGVERDTESASGIGFNAGIDLTWRFSKSFGVGGVVRYSQGSLAFTPGERRLTIDAGGLQAGLGLRAIF